MKRVLLCTVAALFCLSFGLYHSGMLGAHEVEVSEAVDPFDTETARRHRSCQPRHWRHLVLNRFQ